RGRSLVVGPVGGARAGGRERRTPGTLIAHGGAANGSPVTTIRRSSRSDRFRWRAAGARLAAGSAAPTSVLRRHGGHAALSHPHGLRVDRERAPGSAPLPRRAAVAAPVHLAPRAHRPEGGALRLR